MSILRDILNKIFPGSRPAAPAPSTPKPSAPGSTGGGPVVDVEGVLNELAKKSPQKLNWRTSIVDLC